MLYPVRFHSTLHIITPEGVQDQIAHSGRGRAALRSDATWSLRYTDADNGGETSLQGSARWMSITRDGDTRSHLLFRTDERLPAVYRTPHGDFEITTRATEYSADVNAEGGRLSLRYELFVSGTLTAHNHLIVEWTRE